MKARLKKKEWKKMTSAQQEDLLERVAALEELAEKATRKQKAQDEGMSALWRNLYEIGVTVLEHGSEMEAHKAEESKRRLQEARRRAARERSRMEREAMQRRTREQWLSVLGVAAFALAWFLFALWLPV